MCANGQIYLSSNIISHEFHVYTFDEIWYHENYIYLSSMSDCKVSEIDFVFSIARQKGEEESTSEQSDQHEELRRF